ncbi:MULTISPECIES: Bax inhibitor-1/YccA family protein [unclassified Caulobacter]|jgi:FtsH-binding integral membrane protein|uniref:Bax inhibitor-1/YccA family protein n=1 Tax=unclassified Caulobacter TaxID=2648921 RepID=UPI00078400AE|nr:MULTISPECIES: Bax inhibitor-1/YccA family protein [unclassified Caulobacter]AZS23186.1 Bax inhibitor-1/YccA family protein [Caulobacter sp. FWC26]
MNDFNRGYARSIPADRADMSVDAGLRKFMLGVYNKVAAGLVVSGALAYATSSVPAIRDLMFVVQGDRLVGVTPLYLVVAFAPLVLMLVAGFALRNPKPQTAGALYWTIVALIGASLGSVVLRYTGESVAATFFVTATAFGGLSLFGYTTKKDLTGFGSFLMMGVIGLVVASLVSIFLKSPALMFAINVLGVFIFAGLIAYDTQRLKMTYYELGGDGTSMAVATNFGALSLYINFINLFQFLLSFMGGNRD